MTVERIHNGFLAAPDFKFTEFDHKTSGLVGGYAGVVFADAFFIGGGGYGLVTDTNGRIAGVRRLAHAVVRAHERDASASARRC